MPDVTALVPNWNGSALLERLLPRLGSQTHPLAEILVVDNGSTDNSERTARAHGANWLPLGYNAGFSAAVNRGVEACRTEWVAVVNNDVEPAPDWLERLHGAAASGAWFAAGKLRRADKPELLDGAFDALCRGACAWRCGSGRPDEPLWNAKRTIRFPPFTAVLIRRNLFDLVGLLDEDYESYLEDVDFGLRCALKGHEGIYEPAAEATHRGSATLGAWHPETARRLARNQLLLVAKHYPRLWWLRYGWPVFCAQALWGIVAIRHGAGLAFLRGKLAGIRAFSRLRRPAPDPQRLHSVLCHSEAELLDYQRLSGYDPYWRIYFALT